MPSEFPIQTIRDYVITAYKLGYGVAVIERDLIDLTTTHFAQIDQMMEWVQLLTWQGPQVFDTGLKSTAQRIVLYAEQFEICGGIDDNDSIRTIAQYLRANKYYPLEEREIAATRTEKDYLKLLGDNIATTVVADQNLVNKMSDYVRRAHRIGYTWFEIQRALSSSRFTLTPDSFVELLSRHRLSEISQSEAGHVRVGESMIRFIRNADLIGMRVEEIIFRCLILGYSRPVGSAEDVDTLVESWRNHGLIRGTSDSRPVGSAEDFNTLAESWRNQGLIRGSSDTGPVESPEDVNTMVESWRNETSNRVPSRPGLGQIIKSDDGSETVVWNRT